MKTEAEWQEEQLQAFIKALSNRKPDEEHSFTVSAKKLLSENITQVPMLWPPFFVKSGVVGLTGSSDCGKSMLLRQFAIAIARGDKDFFGYPIRAIHRRALCICTEDDYEGIAALLQKQAKGTDANAMENLHFMFDYSNLLDKLKRFLETTAVDVIVLDVWSDIFMGNSNNWVDIRQNLAQLKTLAVEYECLIIILHHEVKNAEKSAPDKNKLNGSQAIEAKLRCLLELRNGAQPNERILYTLKNNYMSNEAKSDGIILELDSDTLTLWNTGRKQSKNGSVKGDGNKTYDAQLWVNRMNLLKAMTGASYEAARIQLVNDYPTEDVPGLTWFKINCKNADSQSEPNAIQ